MSRVSGNAIIRALTLLGIWLLSSCSFGAMDDTRQVQVLPTPQGSYVAVAWVRPNLLAFLYAPQYADDLKYYQIFLFATDTQAWRKLPAPHSDVCTREDFTALRRLPNGNLGFIYTCYADHTSASLYQWDDKTPSANVLQTYPRDFHASAYALSPDMSEVIQENDIGPGLTNQLYRLKLNDQLERLFADWQRVSGPAWSSDGQSIAFVGTQTYPGPQTGGFSQVLGLLDYSWDLYLMDAHGTGARIVRTGVPQFWTVWIPGTGWLALFDQHNNIWALDPNTSRQSLVWSPTTRWISYDWSPDGKQLVLLQCETPDCHEARPTIVNLPQIAP